MIRPLRQAVSLALLLAVSAAVLLLVSGSSARAGGQPIRFSHRVHVTLNRIDCLFCHTAAKKSNHAGIPSVEKCMTCHRVIAVDSPEVKKIAQYWKAKKPIPWVRVARVPDHVYFAHKRMVNAGVACLTCHPGLDRVDEAVQKQDFTMGWCMKCHRARGVSIDCVTCHK